MNNLLIHCTLFLNLSLIRTFFFFLGHSDLYLAGNDLNENHSGKNQKILDWDVFHGGGNSAGCGEGTGRCLCALSLLGLLTLLYVFVFSWLDHLLAYHISHLYIMLIIHCLFLPPTVECKLYEIRNV